MGGRLAFRSQPGLIWLDYRDPSGKKKEPKPKLFGPDIFGWGGGLPRERVGAKKFDTSLETTEIKLFGRDIPGFCRDILELPEKFEKKKVCVQFPFPKGVFANGCFQHFLPPRSVHGGHGLEDTKQIPPFQAG